MKLQSLGRPFSLAQASAKKHKINVIGIDDDDDRVYKDAPKFKVEAKGNLFQSPAKKDALASKSVKTDPASTSTILESNRGPTVVSASVHTPNAQNPTSSTHGR